MTHEAIGRIVVLRGTTMTTENQLIVLCRLVDDWAQTHPLPQRWRPCPACAGSEVLTLAVARELQDGCAERRYLRRVRREWPHLFPHLPAQPECSRRVRGLQGALEWLRQ